MGIHGFRRGVLAVAALGCLAAFGPTRVAAQTNPGFRAGDYYGLVDVGDVAMSPTGDMVAFTVTRIVEKKNRRRREIWAQSIRNGDPRGEPVRLTAPTEDSHSPRWSPDGALLSFVSRRDDDPNPVWFLRTGGVGGEAFHIEGVEGPPLWSPGGEWIAYLKVPGEAGPARRDPSRLRTAPDGVTAALDSARFGGHVVTHLPYLEAGPPGFLPHPSVMGRRQLFLVPAEGGEARQLTSMEAEIAEPAWSEDGDRIFFTAGRFLDRPFISGSSSAIWTVARENGEVHRITGAVGYQWAPAVSPEGGRIAYLDATGPEAHAALRVAELDRNGRPKDRPSTPTADFEGEPERPRWSGDGETLYFAAREGGARHLYRSSETGAVEQVTAGQRRLEGFSFSADGTFVAYVGADAATPPEIYVARGDGTVEERATSFNDAWTDQRSLSRPERITWTSADSTRIEGWVLPPTSVRPNGGHPLVLALRDERFGASGHDFRPLHQLLAGAGFYVFYANPRGSAGYGAEFERSIRQQWGMAEKDDLVSGLDAVLSRYRQASGERVGVVGHGYGGFLATWLTAATDRFFTAVASAPAVDWVSWFGTSSSGSMVEREFGAAPWQRRSVYRRLSPLSFVENVTAPTLLLLGEEDRVYPPSEADKWFAALRSRGVPVEMVRYTGASHDLPRAGAPWQVADRLQRIRSWLESRLVEESEEIRAGPEP